MRGRKCKEESARMKMRVENEGDEKAGDEKARGRKTRDESEKMKYPGMKCHAAPVK